MIKLGQIKKRWWSELGVLIHSYGKCVWHLLNYMKNSVLAQLNLQAWYIAKAWELKNQENITRGPDIVANILCLHRSPIQELDLYFLCATNCCNLQKQLLIHVIVLYKLQFNNVVQQVVREMLNILLVFSRYLFLLFPRFSRLNHARL